MIKLAVSAITIGAMTIITVLAIVNIIPEVISIFKNIITTKAPRE